MQLPIEWQVRLFGPLRVLANDAEARIPAGKTRSLLAWLLLHPEAPHTRDEIIDALWQEVPLDRGRRTLSDTLYRLRELPVGELVQVEGDLVALAPGQSLSVDVWEFTRLARSKDAEEVEAALALATAQLLPEIYDDWIVVWRASLQEQHLLLLHRRAALAETQGEVATAHRCYQQIVERDNLDEGAWRGRMRTLARMGHAREALDVYAQLEVLLEEELGAPPEGESQQLAKQIGRELDAQSRASTDLPVFVGRGRERARLLAALDDAVAGRGGLSVVLGAAGMGRSALLAELEQSARWRGVQVVWGRGNEGGYSQPHAPFVEALRAALPEVRVQQLGDMVRAQWLDALALLLPRTGEGEIDGAPGPTPVHNLNELALALGAVLRALGEIAPHLFLLDDMQFADPSLWEMLDELRHHLNQSRVLVVLSSQLNDVQVDGELRQRLERWERESEVAVQSLEGLDIAELEQLLAQHNLRLSAERLETILRDTGGNPLLAVTLAKQGDAQPNAPYLSSEELARNTLLRNFDALPQEERDALEVASVLGVRFTWHIWSALWHAFGRSAQELPLIAGRLEQSQHLQLAGAEYAFSSNLLQRAIYAQIGVERVPELHRHALRTLQSLEGIAPNQLLRHAEKAELDAETAHYALSAGKNAIVAFSYSSARDYFTLGLAHIADPSSTQGYELLSGRSSALEMLGEREEQQRVLLQLAELATARGDVDRKLDVANRQARYALAVGELDDGLATAIHALEGISESEHPVAVTRLHQSIAAIQRERKQQDAARRHAEIARHLYLELGDRAGVAAITDFEGGLAYDVGDYRLAAEKHLDAANLFADLDDILGEARCLNNLGSAYWELGDFESARTTHERALLVCRAAGDRRSEGDNIDNLGGVYWSLGDYDSALQHYRSALQLRRAIHDEWGVGISLGNIASALLNQGNPAAALEYYTEAYALYQRNGRRRSEAYALHYMARAWKELGDSARAIELLQQALAMRVEVGDPSKTIESKAALALLMLDRREEAHAREYIDSALTELAAGVYPAALQEEVYLAGWRVASALGETDAAMRHLGNAELTLDRQCATLSAEARVTFLANVPINREVIEALATYAQVVEVTCAGKDAPRGRALRPDEQVTVRWTTSTPGDALIADASERRRRALRRLLEEADARHAAPSDDLLAEALGVSRRTILRDIVALEEAGIPVSTRFRN